MLQGIRAPTLTVPSFGHSLSLTGVQKMDGYGDVDPWTWSASQASNLAQGYGPIFDHSLYGSAPSAHPLPQSLPPRHPSLASSHLATSSPISHTQTPTPPPARQHAQVSGSLIKAQPAFKPTWHGFLDTTKDAMTIVEAALQGRLNHISRRPHDKERAEMLTSGTVLVYEENASGIKRWTDAVHWSPSRVMNNCLIYRQLTRALRPDEKRSALNPSCGNKRKRKESATPAVSNNGEIVHVPEEEYEHATMEAPPEESPLDPLGKVYANFAQKLTPEQQRRYCGSLIDSYEFKEGGLMKKTISVKYQGTHHHVISYYTLEDVVEGKLKRPCEDPNLADIQPRPELLEGWKVSLEDEESRDTPIYAGYSQTLPGSLAQHPTLAAPAHRLAAENHAQTHSPINMGPSSEYWSGSHVQPYAPSPHPTRNYASTPAITSPYAQQMSQDYPVQQNSLRPDYPLQQPPAPQYPAQESAVRQYPQPSSSQPYPQPSSSLAYPPQGLQTQHFPTPQNQGPSPTSQYQSPPPATQQYTSVLPTQAYPEQHTSSPYSASGPMPLGQQPQYAMPQAAQSYDMPVQVQSHAPAQPVQPAHSSYQHHDSHGRGSVSVNPQPYGQVQTQPAYPHSAQPQDFYAPDQKYMPEPKPQPGGYHY